MGCNKHCKRELLKIIHSMRGCDRREWVRLPEPVFCYFTHKNPNNKPNNATRCLISWNRGDGHFVGDVEGVNVTLRNLRYDRAGNIWLERECWEKIRDREPGFIEYNRIFWDIKTGSKYERTKIGTARKT